MCLNTFKTPWGNQPLFAIQLWQGDERQFYSKCLLQAPEKSRVILFREIQQVQSCSWSEMLYENFCLAPQLLLGLVMQSNRHWKSAGHWWQGQKCRKFAHLSQIMMLRTSPKVNPPPCAPLRSTPRLYLTESPPVTHVQGVLLGWLLHSNIWAVYLSR